MITKRTIWILISIALFPLVTAAQGLDTTKIDQALGRSGQKTGDVYRVGFPRTDLQVTVAGVSIKPGLALGSWAAFIYRAHLGYFRPEGDVQWRRARFWRPASRNHDRERHDAHHSPRSGRIY